jgi:hypothetical protein
VTIAKSIEDGEVRPLRGKHWHVNTLRNILINPMVAGISAYRGALRESQSAICEPQPYGQRSGRRRDEERGTIVTDKGKGSTLREARASHTLPRDAEDPARHLRPIRPAQPSRDRASAVTAELFDIRDRAPLYITEQLTEHHITGVRVVTLRTIPAEVLFPFDPEPDAFGDRSDLIKALAAHYGPLATYERTRFLLKPPPEVRTDLELEPTTPSPKYGVSPAPRQADSSWSKPSTPKRPPRSGSTSFNDARPATRPPCVVIVRVAGISMLRRGLLFTLRSKFVARSCPGLFAIDADLFITNH